MSVSALPIHLLPPVAQEDFAKIQSRAVTGGNGVERHYSGHDSKGLGFRFFVFDRYNKLKSDLTKTAQNPYGVEMFDPIEMREVFIDKKTRLHQIVTDRIRHRFPEEYRRFKEGMEAPGTPLSKWGVVPSHECATLFKAGIFTVEQLALQSSDKIQGGFPKVFFDHFIRAQQFVAAKTGLVDVKETADKMAELQKSYALLEHRLNSMYEENKILLAGGKPKARSRKTVKKVVSVPKKLPKGKIITDKDFD